MVLANTCKSGLETPPTREDILKLKDESDKIRISGNIESERLKISPLHSFYIDFQRIISYT